VVLSSDDEEGADCDIVELSDDSYSDIVEVTELTRMLSPEEREERRLRNLLASKLTEPPLLPGPVRPAGWVLEGTALPGRPTVTGWRGGTSRRGRGRRGPVGSASEEGACGVGSDHSELRKPLLMTSDKGRKDVVGCDRGHMDLGVGDRSLSWHPGVLLEEKKKMILLTCRAVPCCTSSK